MERDVLLLLLVGGVLLHVGLLGLVVLVRSMLTRSAVSVRPAPDRPVPRRPALADPPYGFPVATPDRSGWAPISTAAVPLVRLAPRPALITAPVAAPAAVAAPVRPSRSPSPAAPRRGRRFTMPDLEEDPVRVARSIAAFLGEPVAPSPDARPHRRRHRVRRAAGATTRTDVILVLSGDTGGVRVGHAVAAALRDTIRESDEVVELPGNRVRVSLDADDAGRDAFVIRARSVVRPWLEVVGPALELHVEGSEELESASA